MEGVAWPGGPEPARRACIGAARLPSGIMRGMDPVRARWPWRAALASALLYTLAFNLTFLVQELGLVLPKAFTPGLAPVLYHNNHGWSGTHPLAELFQGTGALATLLTGLAAGFWLRRARTAAAWSRLLAFWLAFAGLFMALAQIALAPLLVQGDVARALAYLQITPATVHGLALLALAAMPASALWLLGPLLDLADHADRSASAPRRMLHVFQLATLPGLAAVALIVPFRMPREWVKSRWCRWR